MEFLYLKKKSVNQNNLVITIYIIGFIFGALFIDIRVTETNINKISFLNYFFINRSFL